MLESDVTQERTRAGSLGRFLGYIKRRRETVGNNLHITASQVNARPLVQPVDLLPQPAFNGMQGGQGPQLAPDPIRQGSFDGIGHLGIARIPKFVSAYSQTAWENQTFVAPKNGIRAGATVPFGNMTPSYERTNIGVPDSVAYGSLMEYQSLPYGYE